MSEQTAILPIDFSTLTDGMQISVNPSLLDDLEIAGKVGNRRRSARKGQVEFKQSIKSEGVIQPVLARPHPTTPSRLQLIAGYGRRDACIELQMDSIPVLVRIVDDEQALVMHSAENTQRENFSLTDEVDLAKEYATQFNGDRKLISSRLGWSIKKVNERLSLGNCTLNVIVALDENKIKPAHALLLANFEENIQNNTLLKCIEESWSVDTLKERAGKVQKPLSSAKFDIGACNGCVHNTGEQSELFDVGDNANKCSNFKCFKQKTLDFTKPKALAKFGRIILLSEVSEKVTNAVKATNVGTEQYETGCVPCEQKVAIVSDAVSSVGGIKPDQCIDRVCFAKCQKTFADEEKALKEKTVAKKADKKTEVKVEMSVGSDDNAVQESGTDTTETIKVTESEVQKVIASKPSTASIDFNRKLIRKNAFEHLKGNVALQKAVQIASLASNCGFKGFSKEDFPQLSGLVFHNQETVIKSLLEVSVEELDQMIYIITMFTLEQSTTERVNYTRVLSKVLHESDGSAVAIKGWSPSKESLNIYTKQTLQIIGEKSGFDKFIIEKSGKDNGFIQLINGDKPTLIKSMMTSEFDWTAYAPSFYLEQLGK